jgi:glucose/mannose transport system substrate-binding protein
MNTPIRTLLALALIDLAASHAARAGEVEVLHFWTSPGEARSLDELKALIGVRGHRWKDFAVVGGGGQNAMVALKQRVQSGTPPASASIKGPAIQEWAAQGVLANLDSMATFDHWDEVLPPVVQQQVKYRGHYVAVPVNIHRVNWLWSNAEVLRKSGVTAVPTSFDELIAAADRIKGAGFVPIAHGGQPWQDFTLFESVALGVGGAAFYQKAFMQLDPTALAGAEMRRSLDTFRRLKAYTDDKSKGRDWNAATAMVIQGEAAFQFMGDWAKGEFTVAGRKPGSDFNCTPSPGTAGAYSFVVDSFAMFQLRNWEAQKAQGYLAYVLMGQTFQDKFNQRKGAIPARTNVDLGTFDDCAKASRRDFDASAKTNTLLPSVAIDMALPTATQAALRSVVSEYWNNDALPPTEAMRRLVQVAAASVK